MAHPKACQYSQIGNIASRGADETVIKGRINPPFNPRAWIRHFEVLWRRGGLGLADVAGFHLGRRAVLGFVGALLTFVFRM